MKIDYTFTMMNPKESPYIEYIRKGIKHAEGRINYSGFNKLKVGDILYFHNRKEGIICEIIFLHKYKSFKQMLEIEGAEKMLPQLLKMKLDDKEKIKKGIEIYEKFPNSYKVKQYGSLAIGLKFLKNKNYH